MQHLWNKMFFFLSSPSWTLVYLLRYFDTRGRKEVYSSTTGEQFNCMPRNVYTVQVFDSVLVLISPPTRHEPQKNNLWLTNDEHTEVFAQHIQRQWYLIHQNLIWKPVLHCCCCFVAISIGASDTEERFQCSHVPYFPYFFFFRCCSDSKHSRFLLSLPTNRDLESSLLQ